MHYGLMKNTKLPRRSSFHFVVVNHAALYHNNMNGQHPSLAAYQLAKLGQDNSQLCLNRINNHLS